MPGINKVANQAKENTSASVAERPNLSNGPFSPPINSHALSYGEYDQSTSSLKIYQAPQLSSSQDSDKEEAILNVSPECSSLNFIPEHWKNLHFLDSSSVNPMVLKFAQAIAVNDIEAVRSLLGDGNLTSEILMTSLEFENDAYYMPFMRGIPQHLEGKLGEFGPSKKPNEHYTPLELAIEFGNFDILELILNSDQCTEQVLSHSMYDYCGHFYTLLGYAIRLKSQKACELILNAPQYKPGRGGKVFWNKDSWNEVPYSSFHFAISEHAFDIFDLLLNKERNLENLKEGLFNFSVMGYIFVSSLSIDQLKYCTFKIWEACSRYPEEEVREAKRSLLSLIVSKGNLQFLKEFLELAGEEQSILMLSKSDQRVSLDESYHLRIFPLWGAMGEEDMGEMLLSLSKIPQEIFYQRADNGSTCFHHAVYANQPKLVAMYVSRGGGLENFTEEAALLADKHGQSVLHMAIQCQFIDIIKILLASEFKGKLLLSLNAKNQTPLEYAENLRDEGDGNFSREAYMKLQRKITKRKEELQSLKETASQLFHLSYRKLEIEKEMILKESVLNYAEKELASFDEQALAFKEKMESIASLIRNSF